MIMNPETVNIIRIIKNLDNSSGIDFAHLLSHIRQRLMAKERKPKENLAEIVSIALARAVDTGKLLYQSGRYKENPASNLYLMPSPSPSPERSSRTSSHKPKPKFQRRVNRLRSNATKLKRQTTLRRTKIKRSTIQKRNITSKNAIRKKAKK